MHTFGPTFDSLDSAFIWVINQCLQRGIRSSPRGIETLELFPVAFSIQDPRRRYISIPNRRWSIVYALGEFCWHIRASNSVDEIAHYAPRWRTIADGDTQISGSNYGGRIFQTSDESRSQWDDVIDLLRIDPLSRRAILYFGSTNTTSLASAKDVACAVSLQFLLRGGKLHAIATMRSNDAMLGLPYDVFLFSMLQEMAATSLGVDIGTYHHVAGSLHLYDSSIAMAQEVILGEATETRPMATMQNLSGLKTLLDGETACRAGHFPLIQLSKKEYWTDLLAVIAAWSFRGMPVASERVLSIDDQVLASLYSLR